MSSYNTIVSFFKDGGAFMYPIVLVLAIGLAIAIERWLYLTKSKVTSQFTWKKVMPLLKSGDFRQVANIASNSRTAMGNVLSYGIDRVRTAKQRDDVEKAMEEGLMEVVPRLEKRTHYLATFANIATLLGLLGTIIGLIKAFTAVAGVNPAQKADMLSESISVAMNTTAFGLMVAIPLLIFHAFLQTKTTEIVDSLEMASVKFLNSIAEKSSPARRTAKS
ncbi:MAG: MotA/TolQ/ExbB proton channel family protein [Gammaproteobacteria bacterium]|nr:MotA/TolQ/ExbB proton channel family protein [Gammaproteobacteria bacterium]